MKLALQTSPLCTRSGPGALSWRFAGLLLAPAALILALACGGGGGGGGTANTAPVITTQPAASQTINAGASVSFTVAASGTPAPTFTWQRSDDDGTTWSTPIVGATSATYTFSPVKVDDGAQFRATAANVVSTDTSNPGTLTVHWLEITTQPVPQAVDHPATATFSVVVDAKPTPATYQWQYLTTVPSAPWTDVDTGTGGTTSSYTTAATSASDSLTEYRCVVTNSPGTLSLNSDPATLTVDGALAAPVITTSPLTQTIAANSDVTFTVAASGNPVPTYIWDRSNDGGANWTLSVGTGATYSFTTNITDNAAQFRARAHNSQGDATSAVATLTVTAAEYTITLPGAVPLVLEPIAAGTFQLGSTLNPGDFPAADSQHSVTINHPFYMAKFEFTQGQWTAVAGSAGTSSHTGDDLYPVETTNYDDVTAFLATLNATVAHPTGLVFRLPTEAEWEYACRAGSTDRYYFGDIDPTADASLDAYMWYTANSGASTHPVGLKLANAWGLFDMAGNVWELCEDDWHATYDVVTDPVRPDDGTAWVASPRVPDEIVLRGGGYPSASHYGQSHERGRNVHTLRDTDDGFRVVLALPLP